LKKSATVGSKKTMFEVKLFRGGDILLCATCDKGDLLPTIATLLQDFEATHGKYEHQRNYAIQWRRVKE
jgi:hypothetical protein